MVWKVWLHPCQSSPSLTIRLLPLWFIIISLQLCLVFFYLFVWVIDQVWGQDDWILAKFFFCEKNSQKRTNLTERTWSIKDLLYCFWWNFACGIQRVVPSGQDGSILPARISNPRLRLGKQNSLFPSGPVIKCLLFSGFLQVKITQILWFCSFKITMDRIARWNKMLPFGNKLIKKIYSSCLAKSITQYRAL